jgi:hypothetical protein
VVCIVPDPESTAPVVNVPPTVTVFSKYAVVFVVPNAGCFTYSPYPAVTVAFVLPSETYTPYAASTVPMFVPRFVST